MRFGASCIERMLSTVSMNEEKKSLRDKKKIKIVKFGLANGQCNA